jgi:hypothetical protein
MEAKKYNEIMYPIGIISRLRSGESGKCCRPPVTEPIAIARIEPASIVFQVLASSSSMRVPKIKHKTPNTPVSNERVPEKNQ